MKTIKTVLVFAALATALGAQPKRRLEKPEKVEKPAETIQPALTPPAVAESLPSNFEVHLSYAQGNKLVGYNDPRYTAEDKSDYLKSRARTGNLEFAIKVPYAGMGGLAGTLGDIFTGTEYLRFGGQVTGWATLEGSSISIPKLGPPVNSADTVSQNLPSMTRIGGGFFFGFTKKDMEVDLGIHVSVDRECEGSRTRRVFDANGNAVLDSSGNVATEQVPGRGCNFSTFYGLPTLKLSWGKRGNLQYVFAVGRETFEFQKDLLQTYFRIPLASFMRLDLGVGLYPNATFFIQPNFDIGPVTLGIRGGISLNRYAPELRRIATDDMFYFGASVSGRF